MINLLIKRARKAQDARYANKWVALHPDNDAILAICDTEKEVDWVLEDLADLAELVEDDNAAALS